MHKRSAVSAAILVIFISTLAAFSVGFNVRALLSKEYSPGYRAGLDLIPELIGAIFDSRNRTYAIADKTRAAGLVEMLRGKRIAVYRPWSDYKIPVYDGLVDLGLNVVIVEPEFDVESVRESVDILIFPQGAYHLKQLPEGEADRIRAVIAAGTDYIGLCAGTLFAVDELGIAEVAHEPAKMVALIWMKPITGQFWRELASKKYQVHYANGGFFPTTGLGTFQPIMEAEGLGYSGITGKFGDGNVVLFTFHPEGGGLTLNNTSVYMNGRDLGSGELLLQALISAVSDRGIEP